MSAEASHYEYSPFFTGPYDDATYKALLEAGAKASGSGSQEDVCFFFFFFFFCV